MSTALDRLFGEEGLRHELGDAALQRYHEEFTWERVAGQYESLLLRYVDGPANRLSEEN